MSDNGGSSEAVSARRAPAELRLSLLGGFELEAGGESIALPNGCQRVLALLALQGQPSSRSHVAGTLWPDVREDHAKGSLRSALWRLRSAAEGVVDGKATSLRLNPGVVLDIREASAFADSIVESNGDMPALGYRAVQLLSRELLPGWYEDWALLESARWHQFRVAALERLATRLIEVGRYAEAAIVASAAVDAEPLRESARALVIQAELAEGNRAEAVHHYDAYRRLLHRELGVEPTARLVRLVEESREVITLA